MTDAHADLDFTLRGLDRLEAERRLRSLPAEVLANSWAGQAQTEAVADALLTAATLDRPAAYVHARHVGEWAARIAACLPGAPNAEFMRRCGVLAELDPEVLERLPEVRECAPVVRAFQSRRLGQDAGGSLAQAAGRIIGVADEFDSLAFAPQAPRRISPGEALRMLQRAVTPENAEIVRALAQAVRSTGTAQTATA